VALRTGVLAIVLAWGVVSLADLPPLRNVPAMSGEGMNRSTFLTVLAAVAVACYVIAAGRYWLAYRRRPAVMLLSVLTALALLGEASLTVAVSRNWHLSWWIWHLLMAAGFGLVAYSSYAQYQREGSTAGLFDSVGTGHTVRRIRAEYGSALDALVEAMRRRERDGATDDDLGQITAGLAERFTLTEGQVGVLGRAAESLAREREQIRRLDALVRVGGECRVISSEQSLLDGALRHIDTGFARLAVRVGLVQAGRLTFPAGLGTGEPDRALGERALGSVSGVRGPGVLVLPLTVKGRAAGVLQARGPDATFAERDAAILQSLASQLSIGLENARLYQQIDVLFRQYMSPDVATALLADPSQAALGGAVVEVTALFADLRGFTSFSEQSAPAQIVDMLNRYFEAATAAILAESGTVVQFQGDAIVALFNAPARQPDHPLRAAAAALAMQRAVGPIAAGQPGWPLFRIGVNTGPALVGNIGSQSIRGFSVIGDAINVAARLETSATPGSVLIGGATAAAIGALGVLESVGELVVKGRQEAVSAYVLHGLHGEKQ